MQDFHPLPKRGIDINTAVHENHILENNMHLTLCDSFKLP